MKRLLMAASAALMLAFGCTPKSGFVISGIVSGLEDQVFITDEYGNKIDSTEVRNGRFTFRGEVTEPAVVFLSDDYENTFAMVLLEEGRIKVSGNMDEGLITVTGTLANDRHNEMITQRSKLFERYYAAEDDDERQRIADEDLAMSSNAISDNMDNLFGLFMLSEQSMSWTPDSTLNVLARFPSELQGTSMGTYIRETAEAQKRSAIGQPFIDIELPGIDGEKIALSSFVGQAKYVLLDFWASWCGPCMQEVPYMVSAYDKYRKLGFEIFAVSLDREEVKWLEAINANNMSWVHVASFKSPGNTAASDYSVFSIPSNFLIGLDGNIYAKNLRGEELEAKLKEIFRK